MEVPDISKIFLSTPSARRATARRRYYADRPEISIHALREEGDIKYWETAYPAGISIHALREEGDGGSTSDLIGLADFYPRPPRGGRLLVAVLCERAALFLSTPSARRATRDHGLSVCRRHISIHALREEGDAASISSMMGSKSFLSTPSARRATWSF